MQGFTVQGVTFRAKHTHFLPRGNTIATIMDVFCCQLGCIGTNVDITHSWESDVAFNQCRIHFKLLICHIF